MCNLFNIDNIQVDLHTFRIYWLSCSPHSYLARFSLSLTRHSPYIFVSEYIYQIYVSSVIRMYLRYTDSLIHILHISLASLLLLFISLCLGISGYVWNTLTLSLTSPILLAFFLSWLRLSLPLSHCLSPCVSVFQVYLIIKYIYQDIYDLNLVWNY